MYIFILLLIICITIYKNRSKIDKTVSVYKTYKKMVDPSDNLGHFYTIKSIFKMGYSIYTLFQSKTAKKNENPPIFNKKYLKISYNHNGKEYFYLLKIPRGMNPIVSITDENDNNIEEIINPYLGPNLDCHGASIYPIDFGYTKIQIKTIFDKTIIFNEDQKIELT